MKPLGFLLLLIGVTMGLLFQEDTPKPVQPPSMTEAEKWNAKAVKDGAENDLRELRDSIMQQRKLIFWNCVINAEGTNDYCFKKAGL